MKMGKLIFCIILIFGCISCQHEIVQKDAFLTGEKKGFTYRIIEPPISIRPITYSQRDTITNDTLNLDINNDGRSEFIFTLIQKFWPSKEDGNYPVFQEIKVAVLNDIYLQNEVTLFNDIKFVKSVSIDDTIDIDRPWVNYKNLHLTLIDKNVMWKPRFDSPYIPFMFANGRSFGWLKFAIEYNDELKINRFQIDEYCTTQ